MTTYVLPVRTSAERCNQAWQALGMTIRVLQVRTTIRLGRHWLGVTIYELSVRELPGWAGTGSEYQSWQVLGVTILLARLWL